MSSHSTRTSIAVLCVLVGGAALHAHVAGAQAFFEAGYVVTLAGDTLRGRVDNREWVRSPEKVRFRDAEEVRTFTPHELAAFYVAGDLYERRVVRVDETPLHARMPGGSLPTARTDTVFLAALVKGALSLYVYRDDRVHFYLEERGRTRELLSHEYITIEDEVRHLASNEGYRKQVERVAAWNCPEVEVGDVSYTLPALKRFAEACNRRSAPGSVRFVRERQRGVLRHELLVGVSRTELAVAFPATRIGFAPSRALTLGYALAFERQRAHGRRIVLVGLQLRTFEMRNLERYEVMDEGWGCLSPQRCEGTRIVHVIDDMSIEARYVRASIRYRHHVWAGALRPFVEGDLSLAVPVRYRAEGDELRGLYALRGSDPASWDEVGVVSETERRVSFLPASRFNPGVALGAGLAYGRLNVTLKAERTFTLSAAKDAFPAFTYLTLGYAL